MTILQSSNTADKKTSKDFFNEKLEGGKKFKITSNFKPAGDQPLAIDQLKKGLNNLDRSQVLLGVTGSGKTFTMAKIIEDLNRPALILAPNKTLAAQLYGEMKNFFSKNCSVISSSYNFCYWVAKHISSNNSKFI